MISNRRPLSRNSKWTGFTKPPTVREYQPCISEFTSLRSSYGPIITVLVSQTLDVKILVNMRNAYLIVRERQDEFRYLLLS